MRKTLIPVGNSFGFVIDRPILDLLNWRIGMAFELSTDGRRLTLEPVDTPAEAGPRASSPTPTSKVPDPDLGDPRVTAQLVDALDSDHQMTNEQFRRLHHARNYSNTPKAHRDYSAKRAQQGGRFQVGGTNETTARRLHTCLQALERGESWDVAIARALEAYPK